MQAVVMSYPKRQLTLVRVFLGAYLLALFFSWIPFVVEMFSNEGIVPDQYATALLSSWVPLQVYLASSPVVVQIGLFVLIVLAGLLLLGWQQRAVALLLWIGWLWLSYLNPFSSDPSQPFVGLLLLVFVLVSTKSSPDDTSIEMPRILYWGCWLIIGLSFSISGYEKLQSELWVNGTAIHHFCTGYLSVDNLITAACADWSSISALVTWVSLYSQLLALPLILFPWTRLLWWVVTFGSFFGSLVVIDPWSVLLGIVLFLLFIMEWRWIDGLWRVASRYKKRRRGVHPRQ